MGKRGPLPESVIKISDSYAHDLDSHELAWAAGFFDGEGCTTNFGSTRREAARARMRISQSGDDGHLVIDRFQAAIGGPGNRYVIAADAQRKIRFVWELHKQLDVHHVLNRLWPYLGQVKRDQALRAIARRDAWVEGGGSRNG